MIYVITGHLGAGKSLLAVSLAVEEYLRKGRRVASNMTLNLDMAMPDSSRTTAIKLPYIPTVEHLKLIGTGYDLSEGYNESKFGLLLLDEAGTWLNSRDWNDKDRRGLFQWITHARKYGWDVALIVQDYEALDAQIRRSVTELYVKCSRADRIKIPFLPVRMPLMFIATAFYGGPNGTRYKRWYSPGEPTYTWYRTTEAVTPEQLFTDQGPIDMRACSSMLSAWHLRGRFLGPKPSWKTYVNAFVIWVLRLVVGVPCSIAAGRSPVAMLLPPRPKRQGVVPKPLLVPNMLP